MKTLSLIQDIFRNSRHSTRQPVGQSQDKSLRVLNNTEVPASGRSAWLKQSFKSASPSNEFAARSRGWRSRFVTPFKPILERLAPIGYQDESGFHYGCESEEGTAGARSSAEDYSSGPMPSPSPNGVQPEP